MGTVFTFDLRDPTLPEEAVEDALGWLHRVDATFSTYLDSSVVNQLNRGEMRIADCPAEVGEVFELCAGVEADSAGYFSTRWNGTLDPTGLVKGWSIERASAMLSKAGSRSHAINGGGDIRTVGPAGPGQPWQIGVADPLRPGEFLAIHEASDLAVATSGTTERGAHIVNPFTGAPATELAGVTVYGPDLTLADAYATAAVAMGAAAYDWLIRRPNYEAFLVSADGTFRRTVDFPGRRAAVPAGNGIA
jgi:thiamine biosynthesis lipoprotein